MRRYGGLVLVACGVTVDDELAALGCSRGIIALAKDTIVPAAAVIETLPGDHKAAVPERRYGRFLLIVISLRIDLEHLTRRQSGRSVNLGEDTRVTAVLPIGIPGHHIAAVGKAGDGRVVLATYAVGGVDLELFLGPGRVTGRLGGGRGRRRRRRSDQCRALHLKRRCRTRLRRHRRRVIRRLRCRACACRCRHAARRKGASRRADAEVRHRDQTANGRHLAVGSTRQ